MTTFVDNFGAIFREYLSYYNSLTATLPNFDVFKFPQIKRKKMMLLQVIEANLGFESYIHM